ncbi:hypothetical protein GEO20_08785 [Rhodococcus erythropolis]|uniref:DUF6338 family protein n=1 Tax=Rhodococcus erythropolis TaxID=1833 RepID=UPI001291ADD8|nr:DUF6338 family protein [Rhodococcus erythropolis]MQP32060.1 hypothetical protein [Rhodococcus erythropolis]
MNLPESLLQIGFVLVMVIPGIVFTAVRRHLRGPTPEDQDFSVRLVNAIAASVVFAAIYLAIFGPTFSAWLNTSEGSPAKLFESGPRRFGLIVFTLAVAVPALIGFVAHVRFPQGKRLKAMNAQILKGVNRVFKVRVSSAPSSWDDVAPKRADCFVRISTADGHWVGGYIAAEEGYVATYPHPRDIFIPQQWKVDEDGAFIEAVEGSLGVFVPLTGSERVEWIAPPSSDQQPDPEEVPTKNRKGIALRLAFAWILAFTVLLNIFLLVPDETLASNAQWIILVMAIASGLAIATSLAIIVGTLTVSVADEVQTTEQNPTSDQDPTPDEPSSSWRPWAATGLVIAAGLAIMRILTVTNSDEGPARH